MASVAYSDGGYLDRNHCPIFANPPTNEHDRLLRKWVGDLNGNKWHCLFGEIGPQCPMRYRNCGAVDGLELHVWGRFDPVCTHVVVAFRGSDPNDTGDWISNFRWFVKSASRPDQYDQVRAHIADIVQRAKDRGCHRATFVAVGHSLGGGLAQHAAYGHRDLRYVYAFDPSPVTGFFDFAAALRENNTKGHGIDRIYEGGEILALPRAIVSVIFPPSACDPRVRTVRFNTISTGSPALQHDMASLTQNMIKMPARPGGPAPIPLGYRDAARCSQPAAKVGA
jgi:pimeloyl-ACP methyl ester carboxylesterase